MMRMILQCRDGRIPAELLALGINLALHEKCALAICSNGGLKMLMKSAFVCILSPQPSFASLKRQISMAYLLVFVQFGDTLLLKMIRNLSQHPAIQVMNSQALPQALPQVTPCLTPCLTPCYPMSYPKPLYVAFRSTSQLSLEIIDFLSPPPPLDKKLMLQPMFLDFIDDIAGLLTRSREDDLLVEAVGILSSIRIPDVI
jgi:hypothetical protein